jgi:arylsulfatase A-like enzyme/4-amino-4-deoxy-L-arabinose transferase-like glycosyltransferase
MKEVRAETTVAPEREGGRPARDLLLPMRLPDLWILGGFLLLFVASRFVAVSWNLGATTYWEEEYRWVAALEILHGTTAPLFSYQADHYQGGSVVMILLAAGFMRVFGESPAVMKLAAILVSSTTLTLLYVLGRKVFGRATAVCASAAYLAGPPLVAYWGVVVMGSHGESIAFSLAQLLLFFGLLDGTWRRPVGWLAFGLVSGLGLWFCYTSGLSLLACGLAWLLLERMPRLRELAWAIGGGILGLVPWLSYNTTRGFVGLGRVLQVFGLESAPDPWIAQSASDKLISLVVRDWTIGLVGPFFMGWPEWLEVAVVAGFALPLAAALAWSLWRAVGAPLYARLSSRGRRPLGSADARRRELVFIVYAIVFLAVYVGSRFTLDPSGGAVVYRLFLAPAVLMLLPASYSFARALDAGTNVRATASVALYCFLAVTATATFLGATREVMASPAFDDRFGYMVRGVLLHRQYESDLGAAFDAARRVEDRTARLSTFKGLGWGVEFRYERDGDMGVVRRELARATAEEREEMLAGIRWASGRRKRIVRLQQQTESAPSDAATLLARFDELLDLAGPPRVGRADAERADEARAGSSPPARIILIVVDTLRRDHVSAYGSRVQTPNIDRLAERGQVFRSATSSFHQTTMSMAALFTGRTPSLDRAASPETLGWNGRTWCGLRRLAGPEDGDVCLPSGLTTLGEAMRAAGYRTVGVVSNELLFRPAGFERGFDEWIEVGPDMAPETSALERTYLLATSRQRTARHVNAAVLERLPDLAGSRLFLYLHYVDVHDYGPLGVEYAEAVRRFDVELGVLLDALEAHGVLEGAQIVLTSDHGESLGEVHPRPPGHGHMGNPSYQPVLDVPLIASPPLSLPERGFVRSQDLHDVLLELAAGTAVHSRDIERDELYLSELAFQTYRRGRWKSSRERSTGRMLLFDLENDPAETRNVAKEHPAIVAAHARRMTELAEKLGVRGETPSQLTDEDSRRLRALGYLE